MFELSVHFTVKLENTFVLVPVVATVAVTPEGTPVANPAFDVTPAELIAAIVVDLSDQKLYVYNPQQELVRTVLVSTGRVVDCISTTGVPS